MYNLEPQATSSKWMDGSLVISKHFLFKDVVHHPMETMVYKMDVSGSRNDFLLLVQSHTMMSSSMWTVQRGLHVFLIAEIMYSCLAWAQSVK